MYIYFVLTFIALLILAWYLCEVHFNKKTGAYIFITEPKINTNMESELELKLKTEEDEKKEHFFGGYYYPYDYPYYWPYFYSGCNENVFGDIKCLPFYYHPFW